MTPDPTQKDRGWLLPARKNELKAGLYLVATPIGNLGDITLRALDVLAAADVIVCEDTRISGKLLSHYGLKKPLIPYNDHNGDRQRPAILQKLDKGHKVVLISDAGTPLVSDPGYKLVQACLAQGTMVTSLPGANAVLTALQLSGLPSDAFCFAGFLPPKQSARRRALADWKDTMASLVFYETAPRLVKMLEDVKSVLGERDVAVVRELTKLYEESRRGSVSDLAAYYQKNGAPKGEIVVVIRGAAVKAIDEDDIEEQLRAALETLGTKEAAAKVAQKTGKPRKELYALALRIADEEKR